MKIVGTLLLLFCSDTSDNTVDAERIGTKEEGSWSKHNRLYSIRN